MKVLLTVFFDWNGVMHHKLLPQGRTVNKKYHVKVMGTWREAIRQKCTALWKNNHGFCAMITYQLTRQCLTDLTPTDFYFFQN